MKTTLLVLSLAFSTLLMNACASVVGHSVVNAQEPTSNGFTEFLSGSYTYWSEGQLWSGGQDGSSGLPSTTIPGYIPKVMYDSGTFDADGKGGATQCGAGSWGTWTTKMNCVTWTYQFGTSDDGKNLNPRFGLIKSNVGDVATVACTATGKHCVMTAHGVGWSWTQILDRE